MTVKIDGTNTVANPAFTGADTDTGLQCGTNEVKLVTGGSERVRVGSSGQIGIAGANYGTSGQALLSQGSSSAPQWGDVAADGAFRSTQIFTQTGTWTKPSGLKRVRVFVTGGGGGGGTPSYNTQNGGGGAAGGTAIKTIEASSLGSTESVTVGGGSSAGNPAGTGGTSSFGSHCSATGGTGGSSNSSASQYVSGGVGSNGDLNLLGGGPDCGNPTNGGVGSAGGSSYWGGAGHPGTNYNRPHAGNGSYGGGGGGAYSTGAGAQGGSGSGGSGVVYVEQFF